MAISKITFKIATDGLGRTTNAIQKIPGLVITGASVAKKVTIGKSYQIFSLKNAEDLGIEKDGVNAFAYKHIKDFYDEAGQGAPLWFMLVLPTITMTKMADKTQVYAKKLIEEAKNIRVLGLVKKSTTAKVTIKNGVDEDVASAIVKAQELANHFAGKYFPFKVILSENNFNGKVQDLANYDNAKYKDVNLLIANNDGKHEASIGLNLGRQVAIPTQRRQSRIKDGAVIPLQAYFTNGEKVETLADAWDTIDDKRHTFFRNFPNRSGYYFSGEKTLVSNNNDFSTLAPGFVMNEAVLIAHDVLVDKLSEEIPITPQGSIHPAIVKSWQGKIESQIKALMQDTGKISGVKALIDEKQNVLKNDTLQIVVKIQPVGYADFIQVNIGFTTKLV